MYIRAFIVNLNYFALLPKGEFVWLYNEIEYSFRTFDFVTFFHLYIFIMEPIDSILVFLWQLDPFHCHQ